MINNNYLRFPLYLSIYLLKIFIFFYICVYGAILFGNFPLQFYILIKPLTFNTQDEFDIKCVVLQLLELFYLLSFYYFYYLMKVCVFCYPN